MKILLFYPRYPDIFWSFRHVLKFLSKKANFLPLGLLTVAVMLPGAWEKRMVDLKVSSQSNENIEWVDYVFLSAMVVQKNSAMNVISRCNRLKTKVVVSGPLFITGCENYMGIEHFMPGEAEATLPQF